MSFLGVDRPIFILKSGKEGSDPVPVEFTTRLQSMTYEDNEKKPDKLTLELDNYDFLFLDSDVFKKGNHLQVSWGYAGNLQSTECVVHRISGDLKGSIKIEADHVSFEMAKNKQSRVFDNKTRSEVVKEIAELHGFTDQSMFIEDTKVRFEVINQAAMSDLMFIKRLALAEGFLGYVDGTGLHFHEKKWDTAPIKTLRWFTDPNGSIMDGSYESESKKRKGRVQTEHRDPLVKKDLKVDSNNGSVPARVSLASILEHVDGRSGQESLQSRISDDDVRPSLEAHPDAAKRSSDAAFKNQQRSTFKLKLTVVGDPALRAKVVVKVEGIGKRWSGNWYVEKCVHQIDSHYITKLEMVRDTHNGHTGTNKDAKTAGSVNNKDTDTGPVLKRVVNGKTGENHIEWRLK